MKKYILIPTLVLFLLVFGFVIAAISETLNKELGGIRTPMTHNCKQTVEPKQKG